VQNIIKGAYQIGPTVFKSPEDYLLYAGKVNAPAWKACTATSVAAFYAHHVHGSKAVLFVGVGTRAHQIEPVRMRPCHVGRAAADGADCSEENEPYPHRSNARL
jgi:hypothetical protein